MCKSLALSEKDETRLLLFFRQGDGPNPGGTVGGEWLVLMAGVIGRRVSDQGNGLSGHGSQPGLRLLDDTYGFISGGQGRDFVLSGFNFHG
jgi:hypothetical protein